jgi:N-methylhydantoinase A
MAPTITDANLVLGRLNPDRLLAVDNPVSLDHVRARLVETVGDRLGLDAEETAAAILRIAIDRMAGAVRMVSLARGHDPRDFAFFAFGGAGPLHAASIARELGIPTLLIPARPGLTNALGCVVADLRHDYVRTVNKPLALLEADTVCAVLTAQIEEGRRTLEREAVEIERVEILHSADMQFQGQSHVLNVPLADAAGVSREQLHDAFAEAYWTRFQVKLPEIRPVLVNLHTAVIGKRRPVSLDALISGGERTTLDAAIAGHRRVWFNEGGWRDTPIYRRDALPLGAEFAGPAIVEQLDATCVIEPGDRARVDALGNLIVSV